MDCSRVVFVVTGFGPFAGQPTNPTQQLLADVGARLEAINEQLLAYQASVLETHVLEVALEPVDFFHAHLSSMLAKQRAARPVVVCLQFGVDGRCVKRGTSQGAHPPAAAVRVMLMLLACIAGCLRVQDTYMRHMWFMPHHAIDHAGDVHVSDDMHEVHIVPGSVPLKQ